MNQLQKELRLFALLQTCREFEEQASVLAREGKPEDAAMVRQANVLGTIEVLEIVLQDSSELAKILAVKMATSDK